MHTWISKIIGKTSMRKSDIWTNISHGIVIRVPRSEMEMWKGGAAADKITINIWTVILGVVTNCFPNPVILYLKVPSTYIYIYMICKSPSAKPMHCTKYHWKPLGLQRLRYSWEGWEDWGRPALLRWKLTTSNLLTLSLYMVFIILQHSANGRIPCEKREGELKCLQFRATPTEVRNSVSPQSASYIQGRRRPAPYEPKAVSESHISSLRKTAKPHSITKYDNCLAYKHIHDNDIGPVEHAPARSQDSVLQACMRPHNAQHHICTFCSIQHLKVLAQSQA